MAVVQSSCGPVALAVVVAVAWAPPIAAADAWRAFQNGGAVRVDVEQAAIEWSPEKGIAWQTRLAGYGQSSPVASDSRVYVTSTAGAMKDELHVEAFDLTTGQRAWHFATKNSSPEESTGYISRAAPTPVCDEHGVIALFEGGNVVALNREGKLRWQRDLVADYGPVKARHGLASSLEQDEQQVFVWIERQEQPYLLALSKQSGETHWKIDGLGATTWSSPRLIPVAGGQQLVCSASGKLAGFDPASGDKLWEFSDLSNNTSCTPMPAGEEGTFLIGASDGRGEQASGSGAASNGMLRIVKRADGTFVAEWVWRAKKATSSFGSPIVAAGKAFFVNRAGVLFQLDAATGEELAATRVASGSVWATPCVLGDYLYLFGSQGTTSVISLPEGSEVAQNRLWPEQPGEGEASASGGVLYAAVPVPPYLLMRRGGVLYAVRP